MRNRCICDPSLFLHVQIKVQETTDAQRHFYVCALQVGTDPREARYWLSQFQATNDSDRNVFAVIQIDNEVFEDEEMVCTNDGKSNIFQASKKGLLSCCSGQGVVLQLEKLCSSLSFLHRHQMRCVVVLGESISRADSHDPASLQVNAGVACQVSNVSVLVSVVR